jgi:hypothetical protein
LISQVKSISFVISVVPQDLSISSISLARAVTYHIVQSVHCLLSALSSTLVSPCVNPLLIIVATHKVQVIVILSICVLVLRTIEKLLHSLSI